jgi:hypothetical protein
VNLMLDLDVFMASSMTAVFAFPSLDRHALLDLLSRTGFVLQVSRPGVPLLSNLRTGAVLVPSPRLALPTQNFRTVTALANLLRHALPGTSWRTMFVLIRPSRTALLDPTLMVLLVYRRSPLIVSPDSSMARSVKTNRPAHPAST